MSPDGHFLLRAGAAAGNLWGKCLRQARRPVRWLLVSIFARRGASRAAITARDGLRILLIRGAAIGDVIVALGAVRRLRNAYPASRIDITGPSALRSCLRYMPDVDALIPLDNKLSGWTFGALRALSRRAPYDVVIESSPAGRYEWLRPTVALLLSRAPMRIAAASRPRTTGFTHTVPPIDGREHALEYVNRLVSPLVGDGAVAPPTPRLVVPPDESARAEALWSQAPGAMPRILLNISASNWSRRWGAEKFATVLRLCRSEYPDARIVIVGMERDVALGLARSVNGYAPVTELHEAFALIATSDLVITPDTAFVHLAAAFGRRCVSLHLKANESWLPYGGRGEAVVSWTRVSIEGIAPDEVMAAVRRQLDAWTAERQGLRSAAES